MRAADIRRDIAASLKLWRRRLLLQRLVFTVTAASVLFAIAMLLGTPTAIWLQQLAVLVLVAFTQLILSHQWRRLTTGNFLAHLNRKFPGLEESAQLLIENEDDLTVMQKLQLRRIRSTWPESLSQAQRWRPEVRYRLALIVTLGFAMLAVLSGELRLLAERWLPLVAPTTLLSGQENLLVGIDRVSVSIHPPAYTGLESIQSRQLNLELAEGSEVEWVLTLNSDADSHVLEFSDGKRMSLRPDRHLNWVASSTIGKTDLYRVIAINNETETAIGDIYSLTVTRDQAPDIRIIEPDAATLEIQKDGPASFSSKVLINDDHGLLDVEILASVAKGSGEGVKFRDQKLVFDTSSQHARGELFERQWDLAALGMQPGDEVYFTVVAKDNRQPMANTGRSETLIVRWLDDETAGIAAEGLAIDFIPEFFKSQRQIIIDTEQLIEDRKSLELQQFKDTAYEIGQAQADLKQKYGQYLGDEFDEGPGEPPGIAHEIAEAGAGDETDQEGHADDHHGHADSATINTRISTTAEILELFGHDHGDPEIGPITSRNPVALMKRAVNEMWQAEKHLMLAEPNAALPYEYEAWKYLKLARQADRIYVKRLGFEPPPVTEERRLTGELQDILTYATVENLEPGDDSNQRAGQDLLRQSYDLLSSLNPAVEIDAAQRELLSRMSEHLMTLSQARPALIRQASTIEKILLAGNTGLANCEGCVRNLNIVLWNMMDEGEASLRHRDATFYTGDELVRSWLQSLQNPAGINQPVKDGT